MFLLVFNTQEKEDV